MSSNILIVGDGGVGKTAFIKRLRENGFARHYIATIGLDENILHIADHRFDVVEKAGTEKYSSSTDTQIDAAILAFDVTSKISYDNLGWWLRFVRDNHGDIPIVVIGCKSDIRDRVMNRENTAFHRDHGFAYFDVSNKTGFGVVRPFEYLAERLV